MELVNVIDFRKAASIWGNIKSHIAKIPPTKNKHEFVLKLENKYSMTNYARYMLPEDLKELFEQFPENLDLKYTIFKEGAVLSEELLKLNKAIQAGSMNVKNKASVDRGLDFLAS